MIAILLILGVVYLFRPVSSFQAEIARRKKITPQQAKQNDDAYMERWKKNVEEAKRREVEEQARKQAALDEQKRIEEEKLQAERIEFERRRDAALAAAKPQAPIQNQNPNPYPNQNQRVPSAQDRASAAASVSAAQAAAARSGFMAATPDMQTPRGVKAQAAPPAPTEAVVTTVYKSRYLYLKLKGAILKFDVVKSLSETQLDSFTKILSAACLAPQSVETRCRKTITVDRSFAQASRSTDGGALGWTLECAGSLAECTDPSKSASLVLTALPRSGTISLARGFEVQTVGRTPASKNKATPNEVFHVEKVYVTRNMK